jgi:hypothetical protein
LNAFPNDANCIDDDPRWQYDPSANAKKNFRCCIDDALLTFRARRNARGNDRAFRTIR